jgi:iron complex outermembrane receptor protein
MNRKSLFGIALACTQTIVTPALPSPELPSPALALEEVIVTAQRRVQSLNDVAGAYSKRVALDEMGLLGLTHYEDALNQVPGALIQRGSGQESLVALRSPVLSGSGACGAFLMLENGFAIRPRGFCNINQMFEVNTRQAAAIEVLRGPGTSLHGAHALHGVINVIQPTVAALEGLRLGLTAGSYEHAVGTVAVGHGRSALQAYWRHDGGFREDAAVKDGQLNLMHDQPWRTGTLEWRLNLSELDQNTAGFIQGFDAYRDPQLRRGNPNPEAFREADSARFSVRWQGGDCDGCEEEWRAIARHSSMVFRQHFLLGKPLESNGQRSLAASFSRRQPYHGSMGLNLQWGVEAEWALADLLQVQTGDTLEGSAVARGIRPAGRHYDYEVDIASLGLHLSADVERPQWMWRASVRFDHSRFDYNNKMGAGNTNEQGLPCDFGGCLYLRPADRTDTFTDLTPRIEVIRKLGAEGSAGAIYLVVSDAFRPPEVSELYRLQRGQSVDGIDSERMSGAEFGWRFVHPALRGSLAIFDQRKRNLILRDANGLSVSGGESSHQGLEYELAWQMSESLKLRAAGSFARHRYEFDRLIGGAERIISGNDIDTAPRELHSLELSRRWGDRLLVLDLRQVGRYFADAENLRVYPGHTLLGLQWRQRLKDNVQLAVRLENLTDRRFADRADYAFGNWRYFPGRGRSAYLSLDWRLD